MVVGLCQLTLHLPSNRSLKGKRQVIRRFCDRLRNKFHISVAEVGDLDLHKRSVIGFAVVGNDSSFVQSVLDQIILFIESTQIIPLFEHNTELIHYGSSHDAPLSDTTPGWEYLNEWGSDEDDFEDDFDDH